MLNNPKLGILSLSTFVFINIIYFAKKVIAILVAVLFFYTSVYSQTQTHLQVVNDSVRITNGEFVLQNSTSNVNGFLYNTGNGVTNFMHGLLKVDDTTYVIGADTLHMPSPTNVVNITGTQTVTGDKTFSSIPSFSSYYTADHTTNYEKTVGQWQGNTYTLGTYSGGSANLSALQLGVQTALGTTTLASARVFSINPAASATAGIFDFNGYSTLTTPSYMTMNGIFTAASGMQNYLSIQPSINQSSTAGYTALQIAPYESATGSGNHYLINAGTSSAAYGGGAFTSQFSLTSAGLGTFAGTVAIGTQSGAGGGNFIINRSRQSSLWGQNGIALNSNANTYTDGASSGTVGTVTVANSFGVPTFAALSATTFSNAANVYIAGAPVAGTNAAITNTFALYVANGLSYFNGRLIANGGIQTDINSAVTSNFYGASGSSIGSGISNTGLPFGGASSVQYRASFNGQTSTALTSGTSYANVLVGSAPVTTYTSGTHAVLANMVVNPLGTVTSSGAAVTNTASLYVNGASTSGTNNYSIYSPSGVNWFGGRTAVQATGGYYSSWFTVGGTGGISPWGTTGAIFNSTTSTITDNSTASGGTVSSGTTFNSFQVPTLAATNTSVTYSGPVSTVYIAGAPTAGTNTTISNPYSLYVANGFSALLGGIGTTGNVYSGNFSASAGAGANGAITTGAFLFGGASSVFMRSNFYGNISTSIGTGSSYSNVIVASAPITTASSGTHAVLANMVVNPIGTVTNNGATVTNTASLYVNGATSPATASGYGLWALGQTRFDGVFNANGNALAPNQLWGTNAAGTAMEGKTVTPGNGVEIVNSTGVVAITADTTLGVLTALATQGYVQRALSASAGLQNTLTAGSSLTQDNIINSGGHNLTWGGNNNYNIKGLKTNGSVNFNFSFSGGSGGGSAPGISTYDTLGNIALNIDGRGFSFRDISMDGSGKIGFGNSGLGLNAISNSITNAAGTNLVLFDSTSNLYMNGNIINYNGYHQSFNIQGFNNVSVQSVNTNTMSTNTMNVTTGQTWSAAGKAVLSSGTVTVSTTSVTSNSIIMVTLQNCSSCGTVYISSKTAGSSFTISSSNSSDASTVGWWVIN